MTFQNFWHRTFIKEEFLNRNIRTVSRAFKNLNSFDGLFRAKVMKKLLGLVFLGLLVFVAFRIVTEHLAVAELRKTNVPVSKTLPVVIVSTDEMSFKLRLYDNEAAEQFLKQLPLKVVMTRWGNGAYAGKLPEQIREPQDKSLKRHAFFAGEVVARLKNKSFFLLFGATPSSLTVDTPILNSAGVAVGRLEAFENLEHLLGATEFSIRAEE